MNNGNNRQFEEVNPSGGDNQRWEPYKTTPMVQQGNEPTVMGYLAKIRNHTGANGPFNVAEIHLVDNNGMPYQKIDVSGGKVLEDRLQEVPLGSFIMIQFLGKKASKTGGRTYNDWKVGVDKGAIPYSQVMEKLNSLPPVAHGQQNNAPAANQQFSQGTFNQNQQNAAPANGQQQGFPTPPVFGGGQQQNQGQFQGQQNNNGQGGFFGGNNNPPPFQ